MSVDEEMLLASIEAIRPMLPEHSNVGIEMIAKASLLAGLVVVKPHIERAAVKAARGIALDIVARNYIDTIAAIRGEMGQLIDAATTDTATGDAS